VKGIAAMMVVGMLLSGSTPSPVVAQPETAEELVEVLLEQVGGRTAWADATGFHMVEILHAAGLTLPAVREYWVDFSARRIMEKTTTQSVHQLQALDRDTGWTLREGELERWSPDVVADWSSFWPGIPTRVFHLLASEDPSVSVQLRPGNRLDVHVDGRFAVWISTDDTGVPVAYGRAESHALTHFLGRMEDYGPVRLWTSAYEPGDEWRVTMVDYELFQGRLPVSYSPPANRETHDPARIGT